MPDAGYWMLNLGVYRRFRLPSYLYNMIKVSHAIVYRIFSLQVTVCTDKNYTG
jgi:hypothetical protein